MLQCCGCCGKWVLIYSFQRNLNLIKSKNISATLYNHDVPTKSICTCITYLVIISCSTYCLVRPVKATWVCASFDSNLVIISCSACCLVGPVKATWVCAGFDSNLVIISCSACCLVGSVKATWVCASFDSNLIYVSLIL